MTTEKVLITGGTGFLGSQLVLAALRQGYHVRTTVRSKTSEEALLKTLAEQGYPTTSQLEFAQTDLLADDGWDTAMADIDYVLSVASPVFFGKVTDESAVIEPAVAGITRILTAADKAGVKRVVMTANFGGVGFSQFDSTRPTTEADWTDPEQPGLSVYEKSKTIAERRAWDYMHTHDTNMTFTAINPVAIFGPSLNQHVSGSFDLLKAIMNGQTKRLVNIELNVVDVRDVVDLHLRAMTAPQAANQRFIASADGQISFSEIATLVRTAHPELAETITKKKNARLARSTGRSF
ncbi:NAD-dependent epimerase/dehydratase family protein [Secundilactobacillus kimchicus]|uniref:NAD-dependent epimerase/dehydratase family protein n=1 Tax=Secundilactobacillus kimchicus TaxID=528209 RepID=UPI000A8D6106